MEEKGISRAVIKRLPRYYRYLGELLEDGVERISSGELSERMKVTASQIRQDLNNFGGFGQQGYGYNVRYLYSEIGKILGLDRVHNMIFVGAGNLGQALANYAAFERSGFKTVGIFDVNPVLKGISVRGIEIRMADELPEFIKEHHVEIAALTLPKAKAEATELQKLMDKEGKGEKLEAWDWWYYTEKLRKEKYNLSEEDTKPYFKLENVRDGAFAVANKLYGITLSKLEGIPTYHPDVEVFEVKDADGSQLGIFYVDYFPRPGKSGGAWMSNYREQHGTTRPLVCNVCSFTKPVGDTPSLLTMDEVETLFHEFGHALHGLLTKCEYKGTSGTNVVRDFVELPSQINEHWATEPEVLKMYAKHYQTGEVIPDEIIEKILQQKTFNQGFMTTELLAAAILDMNLHTMTDVKNLDMLAFEKEAMNKLNLIPEIAPRYRVTYFNHIIGGYAAGYYSYLWANVLDNDAFEAFKEHGIFDKNTADLFRHNVLEKGDSEDPMVLYKNFRGAEPSLEPLLKNRGMK